MEITKRKSPTTTAIFSVQTVSPVRVNVQSNSSQFRDDQPQPTCSYGQRSDSAIQLFDIDLSDDEETNVLTQKKTLNGKVESFEIPAPLSTVGENFQIGEGGHVRIDLGNSVEILDRLGEDVQEKSRWEYLDIYLSQMFCLGISVFEPPKLLKGRERTLFIKFVIGLQKVAFWTITTISLLETLGHARLHLLIFLFDGGKKAAVNLSYHIFSFVCKAYSVYMFTKEQDGITKMLDLLEKSEVVPSKKKCCKIFALGIFTIILAIIEMLTTAGFPDSWEKEILHESYLMSIRVIPWNVNNLNTTLPQLLNDYGKTPTTITKFMGWTSVLMLFFSQLQMNMIRDLTMVAAVTVNQHTKKFIVRIKDDTNLDAERDHSPEKQAERELNWEKYRELREMNDAINVVFSTLLKLIHINNVMLFAYFVNLAVNNRNEMAFTLFILLIFNLWKACQTYYIAGKAADHNDTCDQWLVNWGRETGEIVVKGSVWKLAIARKELKKKPLGLGRGSFLINGLFSFKFGGLVGTVFGFLGEEDDDDD